MFNITKKTLEINGLEVTLEHGKVARQATGSVILTCKNTSILATAVISEKVKPEADFLMLSVLYQEKYYAAGKVPGGYFRREAKPRDSEVLISRLIDRSIRPLFPSNIANEIQVVVQPLSYDHSTPIDVLAILAASAALATTGYPILGTASAASVSIAEDSQDFAINAGMDVRNDVEELDIIVSGSQEGVLMVESQAKSLSEAKMLEAIKEAHSSIVKISDFIDTFAKEVGKPSQEWPKPLSYEDEDKFNAAAEEFLLPKLAEAYTITTKSDRYSAIAEIEKNCLEHLNDKFSEELISAKFSSFFKNIQKQVVRGNILNNKPRIDGRSLDEIRDINCEINAFPKVHGSAIFTRGETQAIAITTIGDTSDAQSIETLYGNVQDMFLLHYNFPSYSVGEVGPFRGPGRREIGHGKLAWRALVGSLEVGDNFPYMIRVVSEITESNGSSSMATVCASSMSMMQAGVPLKPVAGIAMGLIKDGDKFAVLTDILGDEDHLGDMDFKVAGTAEGITSLQMDIKITSITFDIMKEALEAANIARMKILNIMNKVIDKTSTVMPDGVPKMDTFTVPKSSIGLIIGSGGKTIKDLSERYNVRINIDDDSNVHISGTEEENIEKAKEHIHSIIKVVNVGDIYDGVVMNISEYGAFVKILDNKEGFLHIREISEERVESVASVLNKDDKVTVKVIGFDKSRKPKFSLKGI